MSQNSLLKSRYGLGDVTIGVPRGMIGVCTDTDPPRYFLVQETEYLSGGGASSFMVDPARHREVGAEVFSSNDDRPECLDRWRRTGSHW